MQGYNFITYRILRASHTNLTLIWFQAINVCFQRWSKILEANTFKDVREVETAVVTQETDLYERQKQTLFPQKDKCLDCAKWQDSSKIKWELVLSQFQIDSKIPAF